MAGYWPSSFPACLSTETEWRSINSQKRMRPISTHLDRKSLVSKGFIIWLLEDRTGSPERHFARSHSQSQHLIWFILLAHGASRIHVIKMISTFVYAVILLLFYPFFLGHYSIVSLGLFKLGRLLSSVSLILFGNSLIIIIIAIIIIIIIIIIITTTVYLYSVALVSLQCPRMLHKFQKIIIVTILLIYK